MAKLLLKHGAKVDQVDGNQMTALWVACHQGRVDLAKILLEAKALVANWNSLGVGPLFAACTNGEHVGVVKL